MEIKEDLNKNIQDNLKYILSVVAKDLKKATSLEEKVYLELSKNEIIKYLNYVYKIIKSWQDYLKKEQIDLIIKDYKKIESIISELELCLADLDDEFQLEGISFALFSIGKILVNKEEQL